MTGAEEGRHEGTTGTVSPDCDLALVTAEVLDVELHPLEDGYDVVETVVSRGGWIGLAGQRVGGEETKDVQSEMTKIILDSVISDLIK